MIKFNSKIVVAAATALTVLSAGVSSPASAGPIAYFAFNYTGNTALHSADGAADYLTPTGGTNAQVTASGIMTATQMSESAYESYFGLTAGSASALFASESVYSVTNITGSRTVGGGRGSATRTISGPIAAATGLSEGSRNNGIAPLSQIDDLLFLHNDGTVTIDLHGIGYNLYNGASKTGSVAMLNYLSNNIDSSVNASGTGEVDSVVTLTITQVPEPSSVAILGLVLLVSGLGLFRRRDDGSVTLSAA